MVSRHKTEIGTIEIKVENGSITALHIVSDDENFEQKPDELSLRCAAELNEFFSGKRREFSVPVSPKGTIFQRKIWKLLQEIPYGTCETYSGLANKIGRPTATRAIANAISKNPIWFIIPCHRVIGANGALTGYAGGLLLKKRLLHIEQPDNQNYKNLLEL